MNIFARHYGALMPLCGAPPGWLAVKRCVGDNAAIHMALELIYRWRWIITGEPSTVTECQFVTEYSIDFDVRERWRIMSVNFLLWSLSDVERSAGTCSMVYD